MLRVKSSRRPQGLKPGDYDHEIDLVDHDAVRTPAESITPEPASMARCSTTSRLLALDDDEESEHRQNGENGHQHNGQNGQNKKDDGEQHRQDDSQTEDGNGLGSSSSRVPNGEDLPHPMMRPSIEVQGQSPRNTRRRSSPNTLTEPTPQAFHGDHPQVMTKKPHIERETAIDILYENERGGFLCGIALFSAQALGGLDPPAWTNAYHKASPTNIHTAQVPDPTWEWTWPEWRVNHQEGVDEEGWEYSFHFSKKFSWHRGKWWNSFVRRRAWTRKRVRKRPEDVSTDPHMLNADYFAIRPASYKSHQSRASVASSRLSRSSMSQISAADEKPPDIEHIEDLMETLRLARIDREKLDAVESYLEHGTDLAKMQGEMHEIMSLFVFQASRRILLSHLMQVHDETTAQVKKTNTTELRERNQALKDAVHHADEEVRRLAYWSDVKQMAESGEAKDAVKGDKGWDESWEGVDQSGASHPVPDNAQPNGK